MSFPDLFSHIASDYRQFRPQYPSAIFDFIVDHCCEQRDVAIDVGCGSGQATVGLSKLFKQVKGFDPSSQQIEAAETKCNVEYIVSPAENLPIPDSYADLVNVAQAVHWFDLPRFFEECKRVLKPAGCLSLITYDIGDLGNAGATQLYDVELGPYWAPQRQLVDDRYTTIHPPFKHVARTTTSMRLETTIKGLVQYVGTWSALKSLFASGEARAVLENFMRRLKEAFGTTDENFSITLTQPVTVVLASDTPFREVIPGSF